MKSIEAMFYITRLVEENERKAWGKQRNEGRNWWLIGYIKQRANLEESIVMAILHGAIRIQKGDLFQDMRERELVKQ